ncbi:MAG: vWA domain-containing protein [Planctomycetota bacterium]|nr:vWA domain-containing protein [Planctomycetota bacterium]
MLKRPSESSLPESEMESVTARVVDVDEAPEAGPASDERSELEEEHLDDEDDEDWEEESGWFDGDSQAFAVSILFHVVLVVALAVLPSFAMQTAEKLVFKSVPPTEIEEEVTLFDQVAYSEEPSLEIGANSALSNSQALSMAPIVADISEIPSPSEYEPQLNPTVELNNQVQQAVGLVNNETIVKGMTGVGTTGTDGAVDRITYEILQSMEERPTLVVWFFDQSGSLLKRRKEIRDRFDRIYEEVGIVEATVEEKTGKKISEEPLLTSVFAFGEGVNLLTPKPTADLTEIKDAIDSIEMDSSGTERVFSAIYKGTEKFKRYRSGSTGVGPKRNVMFIAVTDERGDDVIGLDATIRECRKFAIPVYVLGVPSPFGREFSYVKYVDPDPKFDQSPQWAQVDQGPESIMTERVKLGFREDFYNEPVVDSGFGPFALSRLSYETGGIYFTIHPNRKIGQRVRRNEIDAFASRLEYFFDPETMVKYRPDYVSKDEYMKRISDSPLRQILVRAAQMPRTEILESPAQNFVKRSEAAFSTELTEAQKKAARVQPQLTVLAEMLKLGREHVDKEGSPRWLAGFELALGTVLAHKVRAESYNLMLAKAKRGMKFETEKNNTWRLEPDQEISVGSKVAKDGLLATELLENVAEAHKGTPWGLLAMRELQNPVGWKWVEDYTDLAPPARNMAGNNNNNPPPVPRPGTDEQARMLKKPPPKRPIPKL